MKCMGRRVYVEVFINSSFALGSKVGYKPVKY